MTCAASFLTTTRILCNKLFAACAEIDQRGRVLPGDDDQLDRPEEARVVEGEDFIGCGDDIEGKFAAEDPVAVDVVADTGLVGHGLALREGGAVLGDHLCPGGALALLELVVFGEQPQHAPVVAGPGLGLDRFDQRMAEIVPVR